MANEALSGAASGAAAGTAIMPGWGTLIGGALGLVGGMSKPKSSSSSTTPLWWRDKTFGPALSGQFRDAMEMGNPYDNMARAPVADLDPNQVMAGRMAQTNAAAPYLSKASGALGSVMQPFNAQQYMNPYIKNAMLPAIRDFNEQNQHQIEDTRGNAAQRGAFGGSRATDLEGNMVQAGDQTIADMLAKGNAQGFDDAYNRYLQDRASQMGLAQGYGALGNLASGSTMDQIRALMTTGGAAQGVDQAKQTFGYNNEMANSNWPMTHAMDVAQLYQLLSGGPTATTTTGAQPNPWLTTLGGALSGSQIGGLFQNPRTDNTGVPGELEPGFNPY